jgi:hypothetical protein
MYRTPQRIHDDETLFTPEENALVVRCSVRRSSSDYVTAYMVYLLPSVVFFVYGLYRHDVIALSTGYLLLFTMGFIYLSRARHSGEVLANALGKYAARVKKLEAEVAEYRERRDLPSPA